MTRLVVDDALSATLSRGDWSYAVFTLSEPIPFWAFGKGLEDHEVYGLFVHDDWGVLRVMGIDGDGELLNGRLLAVANTASDHTIVDVLDLVMDTLRRVQARRASVERALVAL